jgi:hypothetical protein
MRYREIIAEKWFKTFPIDDGRLHIEVFLNPTPMEVKKLIAQYAREHGGTWEYPLRASVAENGDLYVWDSYVATHSDIISAHKLPTAGGYLYLAADHIMFNDLHGEYDEEAEEGDAIYGRWVGDYYRATRNSPALQRIYGHDMRIIGADDHRPPAGYGNRFEIDDEFISRYVAEGLMEKAPPGKKAKRFITKRKADFKDRYGDAWKEVLYATAWKLFG